MKDLLKYIALGCLVLQVACSPEKQQEQAKTTVQTFTNPILAGFYPDPSICRVGDDYYLTTSTFAYFPGLPILHSKDLVNWQIIGHAIHRNEQMNHNGAGVSRGLFAPTIRHHDGLFYVICTQVDRGGNFIVTAKDPAGPWSLPAYIPEINGIDPSLFFDDDGKVYVTFNSIPPDDKPLYNGHRTIRQYEFDLGKMAVTGKEIILVNGGVDISKEPVWIEAPHIFKKDGKYYLICAEGGTGFNHSEVVFRSDSPTGPFIPWDRNPILTQRHLDPNRPNPITTTGHADFVQTKNGDWWAVFLGCRPYGDDLYNTGRETFLAPVKWTEGWPVIHVGEDEVVKYHYPLPHPGITSEKGFPLSGNFTLNDDFEKTELAGNWLFLRNPTEPWYSLTERPGSMAIHLRPETCSGTENPAFIGHRQQHQQGSASVELDFSPQKDDEKAGLLAFQSEHNFYFLCKSLAGGKPAVQLFKSTDPEFHFGTMELLASQPVSEGKLNLKIEMRTDTCAFLFSQNKDDWQLLKDGVDATFLSTKVAGGFVGSFLAMYATSSGELSDNVAYFDGFEYAGNDGVFDK